MADKTVDFDFLYTGNCKGSVGLLSNRINTLHVLRLSYLDYSHVWYNL